MSATESMLLGTATLTAALVAATVMVFVRDPRQLEERELDRAGSVFKAGIGVQLVHMLEEYVTGFHVAWPDFLGLTPWSGTFFLTFNLCWIAVWALSAAVMARRLRIAFIPIWFFAIAMTLNGVGHPLLAAYRGGYFPGLWTAPVVGLIGLVLLRTLWGARRSV